MGRPVAITKALTAASANNIALSQSLAGAGLLTLNGSTVTGGVATLDTQRRVIITSAGDDSALTWTIAGTNDTGEQIKDSFAGVNTGAAQSNLDFKKITLISGSGATAAAVTVGTNTVGSTPWVRADPHLTPFNISLATVLVSGAGTIDLEYTYDEFLSTRTSAIAYAPADPVPTVFTVLAGLNATQDASPLAVPCLGWRATIRTGTGTWKIIGTQQGLAGP